jgi:putative DNA primase/helicase
VTTNGNGGFHLTDVGNAKRLVAAHGENLRFMPARQLWYVWDARRWAPDETLQVARLAKSVVGGLFADLLQPGSRAHRQALLRHAENSERQSRLDAMLKAATSEPGIPQRVVDFDADPWLMNCANGTVDLRTGKLQPHRKDDLITKLVDIEYQPDALCPTWEQFLLDVFDKRVDMISYIQRAVGYSLTGEISEQCLQFLYGSGANGKSTFLDVLGHISGEYGIQTEAVTLLEADQEGRVRNDVARLAGSRLVRAGELPEGKRLNEALVKSMTGGDTMSARFLRQEYFEFKPTFKIWLQGNHRPVIRGTEYAIWRRVRLIPFTVKFEGERRDGAMPDRLKAELPGILAWAVAGCLLWQQNGLQPPADVIAATEDYRVESDVLGQFLEDCCETGPGLEVRSSELYAAYKGWAKEAGEYVWSHTAFGRKLEDRGFGVRKVSTKLRLGLRLLPKHAEQVSMMDRRAGSERDS